MFSEDPEEPPATLRSYRLPPVPRLSSLRLRELLSEDEHREALRLRSNGAQTHSTGHRLQRRAREEQRDDSEDNLELLLGELDEDKENKPADLPETRAETKQRAKGDDDSYGDDYEDGDRLQKVAVNPLERLEALRKSRRLEQGRRYAAEKRRAISAQRSAEEEAKKRARETVLSNLQQLHEHARKLARTPLPENVEKRLKRERSERRQLFQPPETVQSSPETVESKQPRELPKDFTVAPAASSVKKIDGKRKLFSVEAPAKPTSKRPTPAVKPLQTYQQFKSQAKPYGTSANNPVYCPP